MDQQQARLRGEPRRRHWRLDAGVLVVVGPGRRPLPLVAAAVIGLALAAAACGGGSPGVASVGTTTTTTTTATARAGAPATGGPSANGDPLEYATCMRSHGILNFPDDPTSPGAASAMRAFKGSGAMSSPEYRAAAEACAKYTRPRTPPPPVSAQEMQKLLAVSRCMRAHGVPNFPDPNPTTGDMNPPAGISRDSPQVLAALQACRSLGRAAGLGSPSTGQ